MFQRSDRQEDQEDYTTMLIRHMMHHLVKDLEVPSRGKRMHGGWHKMAQGFCTASIITIQHTQNFITEGRGIVVGLQPQNKAGSLIVGGAYVTPAQAKYSPNEASNFATGNFNDSVLLLVNTPV